MTPSAARHLLLAFVLLAPDLAARAEEPRSAPPIWTTVPTRVDRSRETRERIEPTETARALPRFAVPGTARVVDAASITVDGAPHRLVGLRAVDQDRLCTDAEGRRWACGLRARGALAALVAGRTLLCRRPEPQPASGEATIDCLRADRSLSEIMIEEGWAELASDGAADPALAAALERAKRDGRGIWSRSAP